MLSSILLLALLLIATIALVVLERRAGTTGNGATATGTDPKTFPRRMPHAPSTPAGRALLGVLEQAIGPEHRVLTGVRIADLADLAAIEGRTRDDAHPPAFVGHDATHIDFLVCRSSDLAPVCVVALSDDSRAGRQARTQAPLLANLCKAIGLPLLDVPASRGHSARDVRDRVRAAVQPATQAPHALSESPRGRREPLRRRNG